MVDGILLPYQELMPLLDAGIDVSAALAWAPEGRDIEFSYVTDMSVTTRQFKPSPACLLTAGRACQDLGAALPDTALAWVEAQIERLWQLGGSVPGLAAVLGHLGAQRPHVAARAVVAACDDNADPWEYLAAGFADRAQFCGRRAGCPRTNDRPGSGTGTIKRRKRPSGSCRPWTSARFSRQL